jgi:glutathione S-transferase
MRPWLALRVAGIPFEERVIPLYEGDYKQRILAASPAGKVPVLIDDDVIVWESLAILEYAADRFPLARLWPEDAAARAQARAISAEMHAGFAALRGHCPMNLGRPSRTRPLTPEVEADVRRIEALWAECRQRFGREGPFLFGRFTAADAMYAPVVTRFTTYAIPVSLQTRAYIEAVQELSAFQEWKAAGLAEPWTIKHAEVA